MNTQKALQFVNEIWDNSIIPNLVDYICIPNKSPQFDKEWQTHGYMDLAVTLIKNWCQSQALDNMKIDVIRLENRTPLIFMEIPGSSDETVLLYGHYDKQPEMSGWDTDLGPWKPVIKKDKLFGRGGADDGYSAFASLAAIKLLRAQNLPHARCVIIIEGCEESGSFDLPFYIDALQDRIGQPSLIVCLDSGCGNYEQLWMTTSLRGLIGGILQIQILEQGIHSGIGSGIVPSCFRVLRQLLNRIENENTGEIVLPSLQVEIPANRVQQTECAVKVLDKSIFDKLPFHKNTQPQSTNLMELLLNQTWRPALSVTAVEGFPLIANAGNVTLPKLAVKLSMRIPPGCDPAKAATNLKKILEKDPPYQASVSFEVQEKGAGWDAPAESPWLKQAAEGASRAYFGKEALYLGEGGSIPFMGMLGKKFPKAQFMITGVLGPESNAHGPNEFLHIPTGKKLTCCVADVISKHYAR